jgi:shikimate kinase
MGLRASGKTTVARLLSERLGYSAVDLDDVVAKAMGEPSAGACIRAHGFTAFRQAEAEALREVLDVRGPDMSHAHSPSAPAGIHRLTPPPPLPLGGGDKADSRGIVLALGGGTPTAPGAADLLRGARDSRRALVVYLRASEQTLRARLTGDSQTDRPSITGAGTLDEIGRMLRERDPLYRELAERVIECDDLTAAEIVEQIAAWC